MGSGEDHVIPAPWFGCIPVDVYDFLLSPANRVRNRASVRSNRGTTASGHKSDGVSFRDTGYVCNDVQQINFHEGPGESSTAVTKRVLETSASRYTVTESDSESCDGDIWDDKEVKEEDLGLVGRVLVWRRHVNSSRVARRNVLQMPQKVVQEYLIEGHESIVLFDSDRGREYNCVLHRSERKACIERFISKEWYTFLRNRKIKTGDKIGFSLRIPSADRLLVMVKRKLRSK